MRTPGIHPALAKIHNVTRHTSSTGKNTQRHQAYIQHWQKYTTSPGIHPTLAVIHNVTRHNPTLAVIHNVTRNTSNTGSNTQRHQAYIQHWQKYTTSPGIHPTLAKIHNVTRHTSNTGSNTQRHQAYSNTGSNTQRHQKYIQHWQ